MTDPTTGPDGAPEPPVQPEPVFTARRRGGGPTRGAVLGSIIALFVIGAAVGAWLQWGGSDAGSDAPPVADVTADSAQMEASAPPVDTAPPLPPPVRLSLAVEPAAATVTVDDSLTAIPDSGLVLAAGPHAIHAEAAGYLPLDTLVELASDLSLSLALKRAPPTTGAIQVSANLSGRVLVDGRDRGAAPTTAGRMRPGSHTVRFVPDGAAGLAEEQTVTVRAGQSSSATFDITDALISVGVRSPRWATIYSGEVKLGDTPLIEHRLPARVYTLRVARDGFVEQERLVRLSPGQSFEWVDVVLEPVSP
jgi:hypothetical protein